MSRRQFVFFPAWDSSLRFMPFFFLIYRFKADFLDGVFDQLKRHGL